MIIQEKKLFLTLLLTKELTKRLLDAKGFSYSYENTRKNLVERSVLLVSEISELADAVKKGLGCNEEMDEVADVVIRMCGFLLMFPNLSNRLEKRFEETNKDIDKEYTPNFFDANPEDEYFKKIILIDDIQNQIFQLNTISESYFEYGSNGSNELTDSIINCMINILIMCEFYMDLFAYGVELQIAINEKIKKNYLRPNNYGYSRT